jgi:hypothetical protein
MKRLTHFYFPGTKVDKAISVIKNPTVVNVRSLASESFSREA